jgi:hypothetical protein
MPRKQKPRERTIIQGLPFPSDIITIAQERKLNNWECHLLHTLRAAMNPKNRECWRSEKTLASEMRCSRFSVMRAVRGLTKEELITVGTKKTKNGTVHCYSINFPWKRKEEVCCSQQQTHEEGMLPTATKVCCSQQQGYVADSNLNKVIEKKQVSSLRIKKENPRQANPDDDRGFSSFQKKRFSEKTQTPKPDEKSTPEQSQAVERVSSAPPPATEEQLKQVYGNRIPTETNLRYRSEHVDLSAYVRPFAEKRSVLFESMGRDLDTPFEEWWEEEAQKFYEAAIDANWNPDSVEKPRAGFRKAFLRACRAGVMFRAGFDPKTPAERDAEERAWEREQAERQEQEEREAEALRIREERDRNLLQFVEDHEEVSAYLSETGVSMVPGKVRDTIRKITRGCDGNALAVLLEHCRREVVRIRKERETREERRLLERKLMADETLCEILIRKKWLPMKASEAEWQLNPNQDELDSCLAKLKEMQWEDEIVDFETTISYLKAS